MRSHPRVAQDLFARDQGLWRIDKYQIVADDISLLSIYHTRGLGRSQLTNNRQALPEFPASLVNFVMELGGVG